MVETNRVKEVTSFAEKHTDEQCGLEVANVQVGDHFGDSLWIIISAKNKNGHKGMREEWKEQAMDLIEELGRDPRSGYGGLGIEFELQAVSDTYFEIREVESDLMGKHMGRNY